MKSLSLLAPTIALLVGLTPRPAAAAKFSTNVAFDTRSVQTTIWYPDNLAVIRGVIVFTGGGSPTGSGDTRGWVNMPFWQRFAESYGFGVLGDEFTGSYTQAANGSGQAILDSLQNLANLSGHPELVRVPLLMEGFSNGGYFSFTFTQWKPARVIAFCLNKSGFANAPLDPAFLAVPGLLIWGSEEPARGVPTVIHSLAQQGRAQHALWAELKEWGAVHEEGSADWIFAPFFAEMIGARYPANASPLNADVTLRPLAEGDGWLGDTSAASLDSDLPAIATYASYSGDRATAAWLPSEGMALLWRAFSTKTPLSLQAPTPSTVYDATRPLSLSVAGLAAGQSAAFYDGSLLLVDRVAANGGTATTTWSPLWGGGRGIYAVARDSQGKVVRTSRPANVALTGKPPPSPPAATPVPALSECLGMLALCLVVLAVRAGRERSASRVELRALSAVFSPDRVSARRCAWRHQSQRRHRASPVANPRCS